MYILALRARKVNATGCSVHKCINIHLIYKNSAANGKKSAYYAASGANIAMVATDANDREEQYFYCLLYARRHNFAAGAQTECMKRSEKPVPCDDVVSANEYTGSAQGRNGAVGVEVVVSGGSITAITVTESSETEAIFASVERDLIPEIIRTQSLEVDTLAGATISCQAVLDAVAAAIG